MARFPKGYANRQDPVGRVGEDIFRVFMNHAESVNSEEFMLQVLAEIAGSVLSSQVEDDIKLLTRDVETQVEGMLLFERVEAFAKKVKTKAETNLNIIRSRKHGT